MRNQRRLLIILSIVFTIIFGCSKSSGPEDVTVSFWEAVRSGGLQEAKEHTTGQSRKMIDSGLMLNLSGNYETGAVEASEYTATVVIIDTDSADREEYVTYLEREEGEWKVDLLQTLAGMLDEEAAAMLKQFAR